MGQSEQNACSTVCGNEFPNICGSQCNPSQCSKCGCSSCTTSVLEKNANGYSVRNRIDWVVANTGKSEKDACSLGKLFLSEAIAQMLNFVVKNFPIYVMNVTLLNVTAVVEVDKSVLAAAGMGATVAPTGTWNGGKVGGTGIDIKKQGSSTVQVVNESSETNLHVFFQSNNVWEKWVKVGGNGMIYNPINWGQDGTNAFDPLGAKKLSEAVIPKGGNIILTIPKLNPPQFQIIAIKMVDPSRKDPLPPSKASDWNGPCPKEIIRGQWPVLIEGGKDVVADASAVDGINFRMRYELTTSETEVQVMEIKQNPCKGLAEKYLVRGPNNSLAGCAVHQK
ncbi:hypothetical protein HJC23_008251 [Cyclotella cryptica]|uniref:Uncharacterized protein n=1 Tax=Cyclotella cryptica TaxID=29204 RepID=A0ABD3Q7A9_9STRA